MIQEIFAYFQKVCCNVNKKSLTCVYTTSALSRPPLSEYSGLTDSGPVLWHFLVADRVSLRVSQESLVGTKGRRVSRRHSLILQDEVY